MSFEQAILRGGLLAILLISANLVLAGIALSFVAIAMMPGGYGAADAKILVGLTGLWPETIPVSLLAMLVFDLYWRKYRQGKLAPLVVAILVGAVLTMAREVGGWGW